MKDCLISLITMIIRENFLCHASFFHLFSFLFISTSIFLFFSPSSTLSSLHRLMSVFRSWMTSRRGNVIFLLPQCSVLKMAAPGARFLILYTHSLLLSPSCGSSTPTEPDLWPTLVIPGVGSDRALAQQEPLERGLTPQVMWHRLNLVSWIHGWGFYPDAMPGCSIFLQYWRFVSLTEYSWIVNLSDCLIQAILRRYVNPSIVFSCHIPNKINPFPCTSFKAHSLLV